ncbi:peptide deformylase [Streptomyces sp. NPDC046985]|uniref:peptide deformylase n=1 Tax=Streptomyces sp. NPDC046985 TaxID=3155377 RepID=UPI0033DBC4CA
MRDLGIVQHGAPVLRDPAGPFALPDERETIDDVLGQLPDVKGPGLAAPQLGIGRSTAVVQPPGSAPIVLLTPVAPKPPRTWTRGSKGACRFFDVRAQVPRPVRITVETMTATGSTEKAFYERGDARLIAHGIDHLDGLLLMDRMRPGVRPVRVEEHRRTAEPTGRPWSYE